MGIPSKQTGPADGRAAFRRPIHGGAGRAPLRRRFTDVALLLEPPALELDRTNNMLPLLSKILHSDLEDQCP